MVLPVDNPTKSYWIEAAQSSLRNFQSSPELPETVDVVIVGSGYTGATAAYWLHKFTSSSTTPSMLMLEARDVCGGATGRNGGQLRPHAYSRYPSWSARFGAAGALALIEHEMAHLDAFRALVAAEGWATPGITGLDDKEQAVSETDPCLRIGETFDAAMTEEAWARLKGAYEAFVQDHGRDGPVIRECRLIEDAAEAEAFTQMRGCLGAVVHPAGQVWPYKFVHAVLRTVLATGQLGLHANTPVEAVAGERDAEGRVAVKTARGTVRAKAVIHATNRWASHLLPEFSNLIFPCLCTIAAVTAPAGFIRNTGAQHWDSVVNNYHNQLPPPYNAIAVGGAKAVCAHYPRTWLRSDAANEQLPGVPHFYETWAANDIVDFPSTHGSLALPPDEGGVWTGVESTSIDSFPFVGPVPDRPGHFVAAGFAGHGMPRILLSTAHIAPLVLDALGIEHPATIALTAPYPPLPTPFLLTVARLQALQTADASADLEESVRAHEESATKAFCNEPRCLTWK